MQYRLAVAKKWEMFHSMIVSVVINILCWMVHVSVSFRNWYDHILLEEDIIVGNLMMLIGSVSALVCVGDFSSALDDFYSQSCPLTMSFKAPLRANKHSLSSIS